MHRTLHLGISLVALLALAAEAIPARAAAPANSAFQRVWARTDQPVLTGQVARTWMWGPEATTGAVQEPYTESPGGQRQVQYYDKSRMEITHPDGDPASIWYVTNGLLVVELMTGRLQLGDSTFEQHEPAQVNVAGDGDDPDGPTYATMALVRYAAPLVDGAAVTRRLDRSGVVSDDPALAAAGVFAAHRVSVPGIDHQVASPFWAFVNSAGLVYEYGLAVTETLFEDPFYATGLPVTEAYWARVRVGGTPRDVLIQCFERRCLTYTPGNPAGFATEAGNVGAHYWAWRYLQVPGEDDPLPPADPTETATPTVSPTATATETTVAPTATATATTTATATPTEEPIVRPTEQPAPASEYVYSGEVGRGYNQRSALSNPFGIAIDADGNVYVVDSGNHRIQKYGPDGVYLTGWGAQGSDNSEFSDPHGIAVDDEGFVYVADSANYRIQKFDSNGAYVMQWGSLGSEDGQFLAPLGIAVHGDYVYVTEAGDPAVTRVQMFTTYGDFRGSFGSTGSGEGQFVYPNAIAVSDDGTLYVADTLNGRVQLFSPGGQYLDQITGDFSTPFGIDIDSRGRAWVADANAGRVLVFDFNLTYLGDAGAPGTDPGEHSYPVAVALDGDGNAFVLDNTRELVQTFTNEGQYRFAWGDAARGALWGAWDLALDGRGNLLVADQTFNRIMRYDLDSAAFDTFGDDPNAGALSAPGGIAVNSRGRIYVADTGNKQIQVYERSGEFAFRFAPDTDYPGEFCEPTGIAIDEDDVVYVTDRCGDRVLLFEADGDFIDEWNSRGRGAGQFRGPSSIAIRGDIVYVAEDLNARIQMFSRDGEYIGQFNVEGADTTQDGVYNRIQVAVDRYGYIFVTNWPTDTVHAYAPNGAIVAQVGEPGTDRGEYFGPAGIAVDGDGRVYLVNTLTQKVLLFAPVE